jgi:uncharacterized membrane protein
MKNERDKIKTAGLGLLPLALGSAAGAATMYLLDPRSGRRRRALLRDKWHHTLRRASHLGDQATRDLQHRAAGAAAGLKGRLVHEEVDDETLHERVRAALGRACSHPGAIDVRCDHGTVELCGPILADEVKQVVRGTARVRGVAEVINSLEPHTSADLSALQGGERRTGPRSELAQQSWTPGLRLLATFAGLGTLFFGAARRSGAAMIFGGSMLLRAFINRPAKQLVSARGQGWVSLMKTLHVHAPKEEVFEFFCYPENFPRFMAHVRDVQARGDGTYHWRVAGPAHAPVSWDASFEAHDDALVRWKSLPGAMVHNEGEIHFEDDGEGGTRAHIHLRYNPPAGVLGQIFAKALGADPKRQLDEDLLRLKSMLEHGSATGREGKVWREDLDDGQPRPGLSA